MLKRGLFVTLYIHIRKTDTHLQCYILTRTLKVLMMVLFSLYMSYNIFTLILFFSLCFILKTVMTDVDNDDDDE